MNLNCKNIGKSLKIIFVFKITRLFLQFLLLRNFVNAQNSPIILRIVNAGHNPFVIEFMLSDIFGKFEEFSSDTLKAVDNFIKTFINSLPVSGSPLGIWHRELDGTPHEGPFFTR